MTGALATGALAMADGTCMTGSGFGHVGMAVGELCFNTAMTGYQEILTDPSYDSQIVMFTAPHIGNTGTNSADDESSENGACGVIQRCLPTLASNQRSEQEYADWLIQRRLVGLAGLDTRALTGRIRRHGMPGAAIIHAPDGEISLESLKAAARAFVGLAGAELALGVSTKSSVMMAAEQQNAAYRGLGVVLVDFGAKRNIVRILNGLGISVQLVRADSDPDTILALKPDGVVLSNGPGDPAATARYAAGTARALVEANMPLLAICLGHQILALGLGAKTKKMAQGHHGANHPVQDLRNGRIEIASMNHGFTVDPASFPDGVEQTHISLFDRSNCGLSVAGKPVLSVQHHPEASPGPHDSAGIFERFAEIMAASKAQN